jgi:hypothetical protein
MVLLIVLLTMGQKLIKSVKGSSSSFKTNNALPAKLAIQCVILYLRTGPTGLEPATSAVTGRCSNQLNYGPSIGAISIMSIP